MDYLTNPEIWIALVTLSSLEIVLGIDNIIFISILAAKLPAREQPKARQLGLGLAMVTRIGLLFSLAWIIGLTAPLFSVMGEEISGRDLILILGGLFLLAKSTFELHERLEGHAEIGRPTGAKVSFWGVIVQIALLDVVFSLDSVITAVGMTQYIGVMVTAVILAVIVMMISVNAIAHFVERHPTVKMLALAFLVLIGVALLAEGFDHHIPKGYIYFAMGFSVFVEMLNLRVRGRGEAVHLHVPELPQASRKGN